MPDIQFALTPAGATTGVLDYSTKQGTKVWEDGIKPLDPDNKLEITSTELYVFKKLIEKRATKQRWVAPPNKREPTQMSAFVVDPMDDQKPWQMSLAPLLHLWTLGQVIHISAAPKLAKSLTKAKSNKMGGTTRR